MMKVLFFDTETTGLPDWKAPSDAPQQPRIVQLAAVLYNEEPRPILRINSLVKPDGWTIPPETTAIHGITTERCQAEGRPIRGLIDGFMEMYNQADLIVGHVVTFDIRMMRIEMKRLGMPELTKPNYCTARNSAPLVNIDPTFKMMAAGLNKPKTPKLTEAYSFFFGEDLANAHTADADMDACARIYYHLKTKGR